MTALGERIGRRSVVAAVGLGAAAAISVATFSNSRLGQMFSERVTDGVQGVKTVAAMLAERSPGQRPEGTLANSKRRRQAALHERALPKVRGPGPAAYEALASPPPVTVVPPVTTPLYQAVTAPPVPVALVPTGSTGGGPPILSSIPLPGGGGGFTPPLVTTATPEVPATPATPAAPVPEPTTWTMMLLGFAMMARVLKRAAGTPPHKSLS